MNNAREVLSNQDGPFKDLEKLVRKYAATEYKRPIADHTRKAFADAKQFIADFYIKRFAQSEGPSCAAPQSVILDSGCGTGESTQHLARRFPDYPVIGIDKSAIRLDKAGRAFDTAQSRGTEAQTNNTQQNEPKNIFYVRAELIDFWRLALNKVTSKQWVIPYHALYYPNPWPKQSEAGRRFHLHPIFPTLLQLAQETELRTNWEIYAREFELAAGIVKEIPGHTSTSLSTGAGDDNVVVKSVSCEAFSPEQPITAFERKYKNARQQLWRVLVRR
ncbi:MAG: methyltransferase domain-containing protein [Fibrobacter sp.]|nr:methyltransferase domain-containing protein [Fibrobacter sp.]